MRTSRFTHSLMVPALLCIPSIFQMVRGFLSRSLLIFILLRILELIKLLVAPESTRTCLSAVKCEVCKRVGIRRDLYLQTKTLLQFNVCAPADGVAPQENPIPRHFHPVSPPSSS